MGLFSKGQKEDEASAIPKDQGQYKDVKMSEYRGHDKPMPPSVRDDSLDPQPPAHAVKQPAGAVYPSQVQPPAPKSGAQAQQYQTKEVTLQDRDGRDKRSQLHEEDKRPLSTSKGEDPRSIGKPPILEETHHKDTHAYGQPYKSTEQPRPGFKADQDPRLIREPPIPDDIHRKDAHSYGQPHKSTEPPRSGYPSNYAQAAVSFLTGSTRSSGRDEDSSQTHKKYSESSYPSTRTTTSSQSTEMQKYYETKLTNYKAELHARMSELREQDIYIRSLEAKVADVQRNYDEQAKLLSSARQDLKASQSQLDNVQRFISTADAHSDQDIISKLQELNEEVYQTSMTMADRMVELLKRQTGTAEKQTPSSAGLVGRVMLNYLAEMKEDEDSALFLQIAFQAHLVDLLSYIVSSWTQNQELNKLIEETYQRLRKTETQAICGRWRSLTKAHIQPSPVGDTTLLIQQAIGAISNLAGMAGFVVTDTGIQDKLLTEFGEKIYTIASHAGKFSNMVSGMVSGDFELFAVQPGEPFKAERMMDINAEETGPSAPRGAVAVQNVLCVTGVGLKKYMGDKVITLTKAKVVLESFLGGSNEPRGEK